MCQFRSSLRVRSRCCPNWGHWCQPLFYGGSREGPRLRGPALGPCQMWQVSRNHGKNEGPGRWRGSPFRHWGRAVLPSFLSLPR